MSNEEISEQHTKDFLTCPVCIKLMPSIQNESPVSNEHRGKGYVWIRDEQGYIVQEHRLVWEKHHGRIKKGMAIHHINGDKKDNRIENLQLVTFKEHMKIHKELRRKKNE